MVVSGGGLGDSEYRHLQGLSLSMTVLGGINCGDRNSIHFSQR
jgi:hypothetical protein